MHKPLIKICGVKTPEIAREAAILGADFIGLIFHPDSRRFVDLEKAKMISKAARENGAIPVGVFVNQSAQEIDDICKKANIQVIQLQGGPPRKEHHLLSKNYQRFYVRPVSPEGNIVSDVDQGLSHCDPKRDYLLFDNENAGKGEVFNWNNFKYSGDFRFILAGGLNDKNVRNAINILNPAMVDVSGGVENSKGEKDIALIRKFIERVTEEF